MKLSLRRQLALIGLAALALPWLATNYIRESELALRDAQETFLERLAEGIANNIETDLEDLSGALYVHPLSREPMPDGFIDDWLLTDTAYRTTRVSRADSIHSAGEFGQGLWLHVDTTLPDGTAPNYSLRCLNVVGSETRFAFQPEAPGIVLVAAGNSTSRLRGYWLTRTNGARLEARLPLADCDQALELTVSSLGSDTSRPAGLISLIRHDTKASESLANNAAPGIEQFIINTEGWRVTPIIGNAAATPLPLTRNNLGAQLYRRIIGNTRPTLVIDDSNPSLKSKGYARALDGENSRFRALASETNDTVVAVAAVPLRGQGGATPGALVVRQNSAEILSLNNPSVMKLTYRTLLLTAGVVVLLLAWATWISFRVRRLANAAKNALNSRGELVTGLPGVHARDEIGDLARDFSQLLERVDEQQQWLRSLADKLSHELRTPMAVVRSSLDNLLLSSLDDSQQRLHERATTGVDRLHNMLNAMSQANRAEQVIDAAEFETVDLSGLLTQLAGAYKSTFPNHDWHADIEPGIRVHANADLLVQMLDKLVENAASFSPPGATILLRLAQQDNQAVLDIENDDAALPEGDSERLFKTFVSERHTASQDGTHLGFGLYIAALIVKAHEGTIDASNFTTEARSGVRIRIKLTQRD